MSNSNTLSEGGDEMTNKVIWDALKQPPTTALKTIGAGRLRGKSDINPQWRYEAMTELFGPCGTGWRYTIDKIWNEPAGDGQIFAFALVTVYYLLSPDPDPYIWSYGIQGMGGSMLVAKEKEGLHSSDEGYKMAITDALGTAMKMIGVAADIYAGKWDGSKYNERPEAKVYQLKGKEMPKVDGMGEDLPDVPEPVIPLEEQPTTFLDSGSALHKTIEAKIADYQINRETFKVWLIEVKKIGFKDERPSFSTMTVADASKMLDKWNTVVTSYQKWLKKQSGTS
jgi:hypothetical protein